VFVEELKEAHRLIFQAVEHKLNDGKKLEAALQAWFAVPEGLRNLVNSGMNGAVPEKKDGRYVAAVTPAVAAFRRSQEKSDRLFSQATDPTPGRVSGSMQGKAVAAL
jgi:hypothetical protein